jgi:NADH:ubiquinone oxidoreductase subunit K
VNPISLQHYLVVSALLFAIGATLIVVRRNAVLVLMGLELVLNAAAVNFIAFSRHVKTVSAPVTGDAVTIFVIVIAAAEAAVALAIVLNLFNTFNTIDVDEADELRE